jgi:hypothetical protein
MRVPSGGGVGFCWAGPVLIADLIAALPGHPSLTNFLPGQLMSLRIRTKVPTGRPWSLPNSHSDLERSFLL